MTWPHWGWCLVVFAALSLLCLLHCVCMQILCWILTKKWSVAIFQNPEQIWPERVNKASLRSLLTVSGPFDSIGVHLGAFVWSFQMSLATDQFLASFTTRKIQTQSTRKSQHGFLKPALTVLVPFESHGVHLGAFLWSFECIFPTNQFLASLKLTIFWSKSSIQRMNVGSKKSSTKSRRTDKFLRPFSAGV